ncbi:MAG: tail protein X [Opitutales bacterium]|nr:tail protein X [Opitutales bacterium]
MPDVTYTSLPGDTADSVCWTHYGSTEPVGRVLEANPGLAAKGPVLPAGTEIRLPGLGPRRAEPRTLPALRLWD